MDDLKRRLESMIGKPPVAPQDRSHKQRVQEEVEQLQRQQQEQQVAAAGSQVISAVCQLVNALIPPESAAPDDSVLREVRGGLQSLVRQDEQGRPQLQLTLPDATSLDQLAGALARLIRLVPSAK